MNLAEGKILLAPELVVPVLRLLPQVSQSFLQLRFVLGDAVDDRAHVGQRVWWADPVVGGAGQRSDGRSLQWNQDRVETGEEDGSNTAGFIQTNWASYCEFDFGLRSTRTY